MGAMISVHYDKALVTDAQIRILSEHIQQIVRDVMVTNDVFVYGQAAVVTMADPIEIFIQVNTDQVSDPANVTNTVAEQLSLWKHDSGFTTPVNVNVIPVNWYYKVGI